MGKTIKLKESVKREGRTRRTFEDSELETESSDSGSDSNSDDLEIEDEVEGYQNSERILRYISLARTLRAFRLMEEDKENHEKEEGKETNGLVEEKDSWFDFCYDYKFDLFSFLCLPPHLRNSDSLQGPDQKIDNCDKESKTLLKSDEAKSENITAPQKQSDKGTQGKIFIFDDE